jgi:rhodanese-related sulfurtransferase
MDKDKATSWERTKMELPPRILLDDMIETAKYMTLQIIDIRSSEDYAQSHFPESINFPVKVFPKLSCFMN